MKEKQQRKRFSSNVRIAVFAWVLGATLSVVSAQSLQQKDLMFPQVAAGQDIETTICVTNRGTSAYAGTIHFWTGQNQDWNPLLDGNPVSGSQAALVIGAGETKVMKITASSSLVAGAAALRADNLSQNNFIEGNLVYSIVGQHYDSVGIAPSKEFYASVVPFEDFSSVGLAVANPAYWEAAVVRLRLLDAGGRLRETVVRMLAERSHEARFLSELFGSQVESGKVEIEADRPVIATAVTLIDGEMSALPVLPSPIGYTFQTENDGETDQAEVVLWADGVFVEGYLRFLEVAGQTVPNPENFLVTGSLINGFLRLTQFGAGPEIGGQETVNYLKIQGFSFGGQSWTGHYTRIMNGFPFQNVIDGTFELNRK